MYDYCLTLIDTGKFQFFMLAFNCQRYILHKRDSPRMIMIMSDDWLWAVHDNARIARAFYGLFRITRACQPRIRHAW